MNAKDRALQEAAQSSDPKLRKWAEDQLVRAAGTNPPKLPQRPPGEAPASAVVPRQPEAKPPTPPREGKLGNCYDCQKPLDKLKDRQPFHNAESGPSKLIIHTCLACANLRWRKMNQ